MDRGCIHFNAVLCQQIPHIPARQGKATIPAHRAQNNLRRKPMMFERVTLQDGLPSFQIAPNIQSKLNRNYS